MSKASAVHLQPRKTPLQARSTASVEAILQATIQILLKDGQSKLTTTRIAARAGVSVGTLYQYFPNKGSLLHALLKEHLEQIALAMESACEAAHGASPGEMAEAVTSAFVRAKFRNIDTSVVLYAVSDDVEGKRIVREVYTRAIKALTGLLGSAQGGSIAQPAIVAAILFSAMTGVSRTMLEAGMARGAMATMEKELTVMARAYLEASGS